MLWWQLIAATRRRNPRPPPPHPHPSSIVFLLLLPSSIFAQRFFPHSASARTFHRAAAVLSVSLVLPAVGQALTAGSGGVAYGVKSVHLDCGMVVASLLILQVAMGMYSAFTLGVALWLVYGLLLGAWPIVIANAITVSLATCILVMKLRYR